MKIYAGNLATTTTDAELQAAFAAHGAVEYCRLATHKETGKVKGFGFIEMGNDAEAQKAITALRRQHPWRQHSTAHGAVEYCRLATDKETGKVKGFGFIEMGNDAEAQKAITALNGSTLGGNTIKVNEAKPKPQTASN